MRVVGRVFGWVLILAALVALAADALHYVNAGDWRFRALGEAWFQVHPASLGHLQVFVDRHLGLTDLWAGPITTVLTWPAVAVFGVLGLLLAVLCRRRVRPVQR